MSIHLGIVAPLPPAPSGPADYVAGLLPALQERARVTCFVPDPNRVDPNLREQFDVCSLTDQRYEMVDLHVYHLANNPWHEEVVDAARNGPPGLAIVHDASLHHMVSATTVDRGDFVRYRNQLVEAHAEAGRAIAQGRRPQEGLDIDLFLFDMLEPVLGRQLGAVVHNSYARLLVSSRLPGLPIWVVPHYAIGGSVMAPRVELNVPKDCFVIGHLGYVTTPKKPQVIIEALSRLIKAGYPAHVVFAGADTSWGGLDAVLNTNGVTDHVTLTGFLPDGALDAYAAAVDVVVSLRWPHVGETSGTLLRALRAGKPVVVQNIGAWADLPSDAVVRLPSSEDEVEALAKTLSRLAGDPDLREQIAAAARAYAQRVQVTTIADAQVEIARRLAEGNHTTPQQFTLERSSAVGSFLGQMDQSGIDAALRSLAPAHMGARLLVLGQSSADLQVIESVWGYRVWACGTTLGSDDPDDAIDVEVEPLPYEAGSFQVVLCQGILENVERDPIGVLCEVNRVLGPVGRLLVTVDKSRWESSREPRGEDTAERLLNLLSIAGFRVDSLSPEVHDLLLVVAHKVSLPNDRYPWEFCG